MSEQELSLASCEEYRQLTELHDRQAKLSAGLSTDDFATPGIKTAYEAALEEVSEQATKLAADSTLQEKVAAAGAQAVRVLEQLGPLRGILSAGEIADMEAGAREDAASVADYYHRYGANSDEARELLTSLVKVGNFAVTGTVGTAMREPRSETRPPHPKPGEAPPTPTSPTSSPEKNEELKQVTLIIGEDGVRIGKRGKVTPYVVKSPAEFKPRLIHARRSMLVHLASNPGQMFSSPELWEVAFGSETEYDRQSMTVIRDWFHKLTYRREPLTVSSGHSMGYRIGISPSFDTQVVEAGSRSENTPTAQPAAERELGGVRLSSLYVVAQRLISHNHILEAYGMPAVSQELKESLDAYRPDMSHFMTDSAKLAFREDCAREVQEVFNNNKLFLQFIESLGNEDALMDLAEYFIDLLDNSEHRKFVSRLMTARPRTMGVAGRNGSIDGIESELVDDQGVVIWPIESEGESAAKVTLPAVTETPAPRTTPRRRRDRRVPPVEPEFKPEPSPKPPEQVTNNSGDSQDQPPRGDFRRRVKGHEVWVNEERSNPEKRAKIQELEDYAYDLSVKFLKHFDSAKCYSRPQLQNVFKDFTARVSVDARENKVGPKERQNPVYSLDDMLHVMIYSHSKFQPLSAHKRKATQNLVKRVVNQGIERAKVEVGVATSAAA